MSARRQPGHGRSLMLRRTVTTPAPSLDARLLTLLDAIDEPVSIAVRDRDGRLGDGYISTWRRQPATARRG